MDTDGRPPAAGAQEPVFGASPAAPPDHTGRERPVDTALAVVLGATGLLVRSPVVTTTVGLSALDGDGGLLLLTADTAPLVEAVRAADIGGLTAHLEASAVTPAALPDRVLGRAWLEGTLSEVDRATRPFAARTLASRAGLGDRGRTVVDVAPGEAVLRLAVAGGDLVDGSRWWAFGAAEWRSARLDPVADCSAGLVSHLQADHSAELALLGALVSRVLPAPAAGGVPSLVAVDRRGTRWRSATRGGAVDARLDFPVPVADLRGMHLALRALLTAAAAEPRRELRECDG
ncbi:MAG: hypothetical protein M3P95_00770 [Actinomycetota bacterium]|nr:hypothetical protein [Actinomycetota bacterium]